ncbi:MAG: glycosyltransferase [Rhodobiaceae bacterium]|nr:glycosyltransferase [Rhodobiaceae bacterium]
MFSYENKNKITFFIPDNYNKISIWIKCKSNEINCSHIRLIHLRGIRKLYWLVDLTIRQMKEDPKLLLYRFKQYRNFSKGNMFTRLSERFANKEDNSNYEAWIKANDYNESRDLKNLRERIGRVDTRPRISVLMPVFNTPESLLDKAIESVVAQVYPEWELCIADDASTEAHVRRRIAEWCDRDPRIKVIHRDVNGHICHATNSAFSISGGAWIALLDHDDVLAPNALAEVALAIADNPDANLIYSDEDKIGVTGRRYQPYFKPDFSPELFRSMNYLNHLTVLRADLIRTVGGWRPGYEGSQDYDLLLRVIERIDFRTILHIPKILYHWRAVEGSTALAYDEKSYAFKAGIRALEDHLQRTSRRARVSKVPRFPFYRIRHEIESPPPFVSLIIPTRDRVDLLSAAVGSILKKTEYPHYEIIIVDNGSEQQETFQYFKNISNINNIKILSYPGEFNYSKINNHAVEHARGDIIGLINNDIEVINSDWLSELVSWAQQDEIGCVGAKLYYKNNRIQHAGVILGFNGVASHAHLNALRENPGYFGRAVVVQNYSAVTAACLLVRKSIYREMNGLNEKDLKVAFNDVDFCIRVQNAGYRNVWTPFAELYHHESPSRGLDASPENIERFKSEVRYMVQKWGEYLTSDPYYSPNLSLRGEGFSYSWPEVDRGVPLLAIAGIVKNEAPYILEWIAHHRSIGFGAAFIADNDSTDGTKEILGKLSSAGIVDFISFPTVGTKPPQLSAYEELLEKYSKKVNWIAFIDADEFIMPSMEGFDIENYFRELPDDVGAVVLNWAIYGSSFHEDAPKGRVAESFTRRADKSDISNHHYKTVIRSAAYERVGGNPHQFVLKPGYRTITVNGEAVVDHPVRGGGLSHAVQWHPMRINHYVVKSFAEFMARKKSRGSASIYEKDKDRSYFTFHDKNEIEEIPFESLMLDVNKEIVELSNICGENINHSLTDYKGGEWRISDKYISDIEVVNYEGENILIEGWAISPCGLGVRQFDVLINGIKFKDYKIERVERPDIQAIYPYASSTCGFKILLEGVESGGGIQDGDRIELLCFDKTGPAKLADHVIRAGLGSPVTPVND